MQSHVLPVCDPDPRAALVQRGDTILRGILATPDLRVEPTPDIRGRWRIALCCRTIYLRSDLTYEQLLDALDAALHAYRRHTAPPVDTTTDELAERRQRQHT